MIANGLRDVKMDLVSLAGQTAAGFAEIGKKANNMEMVSGRIQSLFTKELGNMANVMDGVFSSGSSLTWLARITNKADGKSIMKHFVDDKQD